MQTHSYAYVKEFEKLGFGMFVHFGLYSIVGKGEWHWFQATDAEKEAYKTLPQRFKVAKNWAMELAKTAKRAGCKYITLTTRHHDGFSLYDTCGLNDYDAPHSACGRDLVREFVDACRAYDLLPVFYHTLLDWHHPEYYGDFPTYLVYLRESIKLLCTNYGRIGGIWFDGIWDKRRKPEDDWEEDALYGLIRSLQPEAMIMNNYGLHRCGEVGHPAIDSFLFERGKPFTVDNADRPRAGEMCEVVNDHWGYAAKDCNYKSVPTLIEELVNCRRYNCNFLLNVGPKANGMLREMDRAIMHEIGQWVKSTKDFIYRVRGCDIEAEGAYVVTDGEYYYAVVEKVPMRGDQNVAIGYPCGSIKLFGGKQFKNPIWLDNKQPAVVNGDTVAIQPYPYGTSLAIRILRFKI